MKTAVIFDLDGVIVTTDEYHYQAWQRVEYRQPRSILYDRQTARAFAARHSRLHRDHGKERTLQKWIVRFFVESSYVNAQNKEMPCYLMSKIACELVAHKLTGEKGVLFTIAYIQRFHEMEAAERAGLEAPNAAMPAPRLGEYNACARIVVRTLHDMGATPDDIVAFLKGIYEPLGIAIKIEIPDKAEPGVFTAKRIAEMLGICSTSGKPHAQAVSCILNENLFIGDNHKSAVTMDYGNHIGVSVRYDEYAVRTLMEWIAEYGYPEEVYGFERTYRVRYAD